MTTTSVPPSITAEIQTACIYSHFPPSLSCFPPYYTSLAGSGSPLISTLNSFASGRPVLLNCYIYPKLFLSILFNLLHLNFVATLHLPIPSILTAIRRGNLHSRVIPVHIQISTRYSSWSTFVAPETIRLTMNNAEYKRLDEEYLDEGYLEEDYLDEVYRPSKRTKRSTSAAATLDDSSTATVSILPKHSRVSTNLSIQNQSRSSDVINTPADPSPVGGHPMETRSGNKRKRTSETAPSATEHLHAQGSSASLPPPPAGLPTSGTTHSDAAEISRGAQDLGLHIPGSFPPSSAGTPISSAKDSDAEDMSLGEQGDGLYIPGSWPTHQLGS